RKRRRRRRGGDDTRRGLRPDWRAELGDDASAELGGEDEYELGGERLVRCKLRSVQGGTSADASLFAAEAHIPLRPPDSDAVAEAAGGSSRKSDRFHLRTD
ncbi:MAG TPA: hypothetical protein VJP41_08905, partial [Gaiellaceae bacterium]|nr:hypothetical protein [Gaiellaceae bacterium]